MTREHDPILDRVREQVPPPGDAFERLERRREAKAMRSRIVAGAVGLGVTGALVTGLVLSGSLSSGSAPDRSGPASGGTPSGAWTMPDGLMIPDGSFAYVHVVEYSGAGQPGSPIEERSWFSPSDGSGRVTGSGVASAPPLEACAQTQCPYSNDDSYGPGEMEKGSGEQWFGLGDLSTDPAVLAEQLAAPYLSPGASPIPQASGTPSLPTSAGSPSASAIPTVSPDPTVTGSVADMANLVLISAHTATPELKAALSQVLAGLEGAMVSTATSDPVGRPAWSVRLEHGPGQGAGVETWWFDPQSDQLLGIRARRLRAHLLQRRGCRCGRRDRRHDSSARVHPCDDRRASRARTRDPRVTDPGYRSWIGGTDRRPGDRHPQRAGDVLAVDPRAGHTLGVTPPGLAAILRARRA